MKSFLAIGWTALWRGSVVVCLAYGFCFSQCNPIDFSAPSQACLNQNLTFTPAANYPSYEWDFCAGDLEQTPTATPFLNYSGSNTVEMFQDNGSYYGFFLSRDNAKLYRLDFGTTITNPPAVVDLGGLGIDLSAPRTVRIAKEGSTYYGFLIAGNSLYRINFGNVLKSVPANAELLFSGNPLSSPIDMALVQEAGKTFLFIVNSGNALVVRFQINSLADAPGLIQMNKITAPNALDGISFMKECNDWYALTTAFSPGQLYRMFFAAGLTDPKPKIDTVSIGLSLHSPAGIALVEDNGNYYSFIKDDGILLYKISFGNSISNVSPVGVNLGNIGMTKSGFGFSMYKAGSNWVGFVTNSTIYKITFPNNCFSNTQYSTAAAPSVTTTNPGSYFISLAIKDALGHRIVKSKSILITNSTAPDIDFSSQNICANSNVNFTSSNASGNLITYAWDFGDGNTDPTGSPSHVYASAGVFNVSLNVGASNSCSNQVQKTITIFNPPVADFTLPAVGTVCTNQNYTFSNHSTFDAGSNPTWQWLINGIPTSSSPDLIQSFNSATTRPIQLIATIPGCSSQKLQNFIVQQTGPIVDFNMGNGCQGSPLQFNNTTVGGGINYTWTFGDGNSSPQFSPTNKYTSFGVFSVNLVASSVNGCQNSNTKSVTVYSTPQSDFSLALPPFSCSGTPSQFNDTTPNPTDSNLLTWGWNFGDTGNDSSVQRNPFYTYKAAGPYTVGMTVTTNFGCRAVVQKLITITQSPIASFTNSPACVNQGTQFTDTSVGSIKTWFWKIGNSNYNYYNPVQVFSSAATYPVQFTVTDFNGCIGQITKSVNVPLAQSPDFSALSTCATKTAIFQNTTPANTDSFVSFAWDFAGQGSGTGPQAPFIFPATGNFSVKMNAHAQSGCVYSVTKTIAIVSPPKAGFTTSTDAGAAPLNVQFTNASSGASSYLWHFHDSGDSTSIVMSPSFIFKDLGDYVVDLDATSIQGCVDTFSKIIHAVLPQVDASLTNLQFIRDPSSGQLQALFVIDNLGNLPLNNPTIIVEISGNATLRENLNLVVLPGQTASQVLNYSFLSTGLAYVCLRVVASQDINPSNDKECVSLNQENIVFAPYPNPVRGELHFDWIASGDEPAQIAIFNATGAKAFDKQLESAQAGLNQIKIDVSNLTPGVYLALFTYPGFKKTFRFIVN